MGARKWANQCVGQCQTTSNSISSEGWGFLRASDRSYQTHIGFVRDRSIGRSLDLPLAGLCVALHRFPVTDCHSRRPTRSYILGLTYHGSLYLGLFLGGTLILTFHRNLEHFGGSDCYVNRIKVARIVALKMCFSLYSYGDASSEPKIRLGFMRYELNARVCLYGIVKFEGNWLCRVDTGNV